ncbi:hypothetical protein [Photobacterium aquae]|uniref:hypothetical protein n=1 Tax=Photobacterium aquae TaxID=1195763 RepID=UPI0009FEE9D5|nr:hypothetical protein [Photobacterium aquae]
MPLKDYSEEEDYYSQGFEKTGVVSVWIGLLDDAWNSEDIDVLQDLCGVGYYDLSNQESECFDYQLVPISKLLGNLSYSGSFSSEVMKVAESKALQEARWAVQQYDFAYNPSKVRRSIASDPKFIGVFSYEI